MRAQTHFSPVWRRICVVCSLKSTWLHLFILHLCELYRVESRKSCYSCCGAHFSSMQSRTEASAEDVWPTCCGANAHGFSKLKGRHRWRRRRGRRLVWNWGNHLSRATRKPCGLSKTFLWRHRYGLVEGHAKRQYCRTCIQIGKNESHQRYSQSSHWAQLYSFLPAIGTTTSNDTSLMALFSL